MQSVLSRISFIAARTSIGKDFKVAVNGICVAGAVASLGAVGVGVPTDVDVGAVGIAIAVASVGAVGIAVASVGVGAVVDDDDDDGMCDGVDVDVLLSEAVDVDCG